MKILVAFKICPDLDRLRPEDLQVSGKLSADTHFLPNLLNCYDESALELALRARDAGAQHGQTAELSALTIGGENTEPYLQTLRALGYAHTVRVPADPEQLRFCPETTAETIARYAAAHEADLILTGREAPLGSAAAVGPYLAARRGCALYTPVTDFSLEADGSVRVETEADGRRARWAAKTPAVLCIGNAVVSKLRVPSLRMRMQCRGAQTEPWPLAEAAGARYAAPALLEVPQRRREGFTSPAHGAQAVEDLWRHGLSERLERL
jgi:electron transfer flavoprotein beta subunit